jgi:hypothetical protein
MSLREEISRRNMRERNLTEDAARDEIEKYGCVRSVAGLKLDASALEQRRIGILLLANEDGKLLLSMLENLYYRGDLVGVDPYETYRNLGRRDVVEFLLSLRDQATKEK